MPLDLQKLLDHRIPTVEMHLTSREAMLYALAVGLGADPIDDRQLQYVFEDKLKIVPTMAAIVATPYAWFKNAQIGSGKSVQAGIGIEYDRPLQIGHHYIGRTKLAEVIDKGEGAPAIIVTKREILEKETGDIVATVTASNLLRGDGGFGGKSQSSSEMVVIPDRRPDVVVEMPTSPRMALLYRLTGDLNHLHADPRVAKRSGFDRPILHGLCTFGIAGHAILREVCDYAPDKFKSISAKFVRPVFPGETLSFSLWLKGREIFFRGHVPARKEVVLDQGHAVLM